MSHFILSEQTDFSANRTIDWLDYYNIDFKKFIGFNNPNEDHYDFTDNQFSIKFGGIENETDSSFFINETETKIENVWFRRPYSWGEQMVSEYPYVEKSFPYKNFDDTITNRFRIFWDFIGYKLTEKRHIGSFKIYEMNKPIVLQKAQNIGLTIPKTLITNNKEELTRFFNDCNGKIITKSLHECIRDHKHEIDHDNNIMFYQMTQAVEQLETKTPNIFAPSMFQECIEKEYEIRTVFFEEKCYSAALFSQLNENTQIDMRNRDANKPTRYIPYQLPIDIENKLNELMKQLGLNFGAVDFMKSKEGNYYFLEINPVGQYGDVSMICNYHIEKKIADILMNKK